MPAVQLSRDTSTGQNKRTAFSSILGVILAVIAMAVPGVARADFPEADIPGSILAVELLYPSVKMISLHELNAVFDQAMVVDVRTPFEFDLVHISGSLSRPFSDDDDRDTTGELELLPGKSALVFTGNDIHDARPFKAALAARARGIASVAVYREGVLAWADAFAHKIQIMGSDGEIQEHLVDFAAFLDAAQRPGTLIIDIRNAWNRTWTPAIPGSLIQAIPMEAFLEAVQCRIWSEKSLLIFDSSGSRLPWLHRFLEAKGYDRVLFLDKGVQSLDFWTLASKNPDSTAISLDQERFHKFIMGPVLSDVHKRFMLLVVSVLHHENCAILKISDGVKTMGGTVTDLFDMAKVLAEDGHVRYMSATDFLVFRVDPRLAFKGAMKGKTWNEQVQNFLSPSEPGRSQ
jgi:rhodanese-related sulfurtransferase